MKFEKLNINFILNIINYPYISKMTTFNEICKTNDEISRIVISTNPTLHKPIIKKISNISNISNTSNKYIIPESNDNKPIKSKDKKEKPKWVCNLCKENANISCKSNHYYMTLSSDKPEDVAIAIPKASKWLYNCTICNISLPTNSQFEKHILESHIRE